MRFERFVALVLIALCVAGASPVWQADVGASFQDISGTVLQADGTHPAANMRLRLKNVDTATIVAETVSDANGTFSFAVPGAGLYVIEAVDEHGVRGISEPFPFTGSPLTTSVILSRDRTKEALYIGSVALLAAGGAAGIASVTGGSSRVESPER
jgi:hypothetical protein